LGAARFERGDFKPGKLDQVWKHSKIKYDNGLDGELGYSFLDNLHRVSIHYTFNRRSLQATDEIRAATRRPDSFTINHKTEQSGTLAYEGKTENKLFSWEAFITKGYNRYAYYSYTDPSVTSSQFTYPDASSLFVQNTDLLQYGIQATFDHKLITLTLGYEFIRYDPDNLSETYQRNAPSVIAIASSYLENNGTYLLGKIKLLDDNLFINFGGRYDTFKNVSIEGAGQPDKSVSKSKFTPSFGLAYSPTEYLKLRANYSEGFLMPNPNQFNGGGRYYLPNPDVRPEESKTYEFGADLSWDYIDSSLTYFHTKYNNKLQTRYVTPAPDPDWPLRRYQYVNYKGAIFSGIEFSFGVDIARYLGYDFNLRPRVNFTKMIKVENQDKDHIIPHDPKAMADIPKLTGNFGIDFSDKDIGLDATLNISYVGKSWTLDHGGTYLTSINGYVWHGGFTVVDLSLSKVIYDFGNESTLSLKVQANNITDEYLDYEIDYPQPGRNFYMGILYKF
jgi:vitamin B12 transporter